MEAAVGNNLVPIIVALIGSQGLIAAALIAMAYRIGRMPSREEFNALHKEVTDNKAELKQDIADAKAELKQDIADAKAELKQDIADAEAELKQDIADAKIEVLQEIRRSHQQIMLALINHTHLESGEAVFTLPPDLELVPAPADN